MTKDADMWAFEGVLRASIIADLQQFLQTHTMWDDEELLDVIRNNKQSQ